MEPILKKNIEDNALELVIDTKIFNKDIVLKAAFNHLDEGYFLFSTRDDGNILLQFTPRDNSPLNSTSVVAGFSDNLIEVYLRDKLERENKDIREKIIWAAIANSIDSNGFVSIDTERKSDQNQVDFDKDIDEILKEIENDPDLKIDEAEIERILKEIEEETQWMQFEEVKPTITLDTNAVKNAKEKFQNR